MNHVQSCFFPKTVFNVYTGQKIVTRCGKCAACRNSKANEWVTRLDMESCCHKYTLFCTLTYDELNVPQVVRLRKDDYPNAAYIDSESGELIDVRDIKAQFDRKDWDYISDTKVLNRLLKSDFQKFIKRLRYYFYETDKARLRYYLGAEIGPSTYRPHGHLLLFFDSERCLSQIEVLLSKAWSFGLVYEPHLVSGSAAEYCASYVNGLTELPKIYLHRALRPFAIYSKSPSIGSDYELVKADRDDVIGGACTFRFKRPSSTKFTDVPLWRSLEARRYPRLPRFGCLSDDDRVALYKMCESEAFRTASTAEEFACYLERTFIACRTNFNSIGFKWRYFTEVSSKYVYKTHFNIKDVILPWYFKSLPFLPKDYVGATPISGNRVLTREYCFNSLVRFARVLSVFARNKELYGFTTEEYVKIIIDYYDRKENLKKRRDYDWQDSYFMHHPAFHWIYFDKDFYDKVTSVDASNWSDGTLNTLYYLFPDGIPYKEVNGGKDVIMVLDIPPLETLEEFSSFKALHQKIAHDLVKQKKNNDYTLLHKDKFGNIIKFQNV